MKKYSWEPNYAQVCGNIATVMPRPLVSIIIPAYNMAPWIEATLSSVLAQSITDFECLVVDNASTDDTVMRAQSFNDPRIHIIHEPRSGVSAARNAGLDAARGKFISFIDGDDIWSSKALEMMLAPLLADPECGLSWAEFRRFEDKTGVVMPLVATRLQHTGNMWLDMLVDNFMQFGALCLRQELAQSCRFDESLVICEDRDWLLRVLKGTKTAHVPQVAHFYRQRANSAIRDIERFLADESRLMSRHLADECVPPKIRRRALSALNFHAAVLLAKIPGKKKLALARYLQAVKKDPLYLENYLRPLRKIWFKIAPKTYLDQINPDKVIA